VRVSPVQDTARRAEFEQLVAQAYEPLQRYLRRRADPATAEDVLGDVLLVLWRRVDEIPADAPVAWAYGVARGCLANQMRGATRQDRLVERLKQEPAGGPDLGTEHEALDDALACCGCGRGSSSPRVRSRQFWTSRPTPRASGCTARSES
jgi:RNA polymerase sigma-70 factor (ECF subfamily)